MSLFEISMHASIFQISLPLFFALLRECMTIARQYVNVNVSAEPYEVSLLWVLFYIKLCGGTQRIHATENGAQVLLFWVFT